MMVAGDNNEMRRGRLKNFFQDFELFFKSLSYECEDLCPGSKFVNYWALEDFCSRGFGA